MKYIHPLQANTYTVDPRGFQMPYTRYGKLDEERLKWKYFRLSNYPSRPTKIRCNNHVYGNCERRSVYARI